MVFDEYDRELSTKDEEHLRRSATTDHVDVEVRVKNFMYP